MAVASDAETFSSERAPGAEGGGTIIQDLPYGFAPGVLLNMMDDPRHQRIRRLVTPSVAPRALTLMEAELRERAARIVDAVADRGQCDLLSEVAVELPLQAVAALMGVPDADRHDLMAWSNTTLDYEGRELGETNDRVAAAAASDGRLRVTAHRRQEAVTGRRHHLGSGPTPKSTMDGAGPRPPHRPRTAHVLQPAGGGGQRDHPELDRPRHGGTGRASRPARRPRPPARAHAHGGGGDPPVDHRHPLQPADGHPGHVDRRPGHRGGGQGDPVVAVGQPGRRRVRPTVPVRHHAGRRTPI